MVDPSEIWQNQKQELPVKQDLCKLTSNFCIFMKVKKLLNKRWQEMKIPRHGHMTGVYFTCQKSFSAGASQNCIWSYHWTSLDQGTSLWKFQIQKFKKITNEIFRGYLC